VEILENFNLRLLNTFGVEASSRYFVEVTTTPQLVEILKRFETSNVQCLMMGGGSNMLFTKNYHGAVVRLDMKGIKVVRETENEIWVEAQAGEVWDEFVQYCVDRGWGGLENLSWIPGNVGSSPIQNIGAYGVEIKDCFHSLTAYDRNSGLLEVLSNHECAFGYRNSIFKTLANNPFVIVSVVFRLTKQVHRINLSYGALELYLKDHGINAPNLTDVRDAVVAIRKQKLPDPVEIGNAGSFFKNPIISRDVFDALYANFPDAVFFKEGDSYKLAAGWLIEKAGWKGYREGDAGVHPKQALVLVNYGKASGSQILQLAEKIVESIEQKFAITLQMEVNIIA